MQSLLFLSMFAIRLWTNPELELRPIQAGMNNLRSGWYVVFVPRKSKSGEVCLHFYTDRSWKKRDSAGNGSVKRVSIRGKKQSLFGISGLVNVWAVKLHGVIKNYESGVIKAVGLSATGARSPTEIVRGSIPHSIRTLNDFPVPALVFLQLLLFHLTIQTH